jgi:hypothetical protein
VGARGVSVAVRGVPKTVTMRGRWAPVRCVRLRHLRPLLVALSACWATGTALGGDLPSHVPRVDPGRPGDAIEQEVQEKLEESREGRPAPTPRRPRFDPRRSGDQLGRPGDALEHEVRDTLRRARTDLAIVGARPALPPIVDSFQVAIEVTVGNLGSEPARFVVGAPNIGGLWISAPQRLDPGERRIVKVFAGTRGLVEKAIFTTTVAIGAPDTPYEFRDANPANNTRTVSFPVEARTYTVKAELEEIWVGSYCDPERGEAGEWEFTLWVKPFGGRAPPAKDTRWEAELPGGTHVPWTRSGPVRVRIERVPSDVYLELGLRARENDPIGVIDDWTDIGRSAIRLAPSEWRAIHGRGPLPGTIQEADAPPPEPDPDADLPYNASRHHLEVGLEGAHRRRDQCWAKAEILLQAIPEYHRGTVRVELP